MGPGGHGNKALDSIHVGFRMSLPELAVPVGPERASMRKLSLCVLPWTRLVVRVSGRFSGVFCLGKQLESPGGRRDYKPGAHPWGPVRAHRGWTAVIGGNSCGFSLSLLLEFHPFMAVTHFIVCLLNVMLADTTSAVHLSLMQGRFQRELGTLVLRNSFTRRLRPVFI